MSFIKANQDELLDGFCRGCLKKYNDPADLLHYTEKNRRLFVYSTGIQVKRNDTFTFQICKDCYGSMKVSCKFKKQCRTSDKRFKMFLRIKELGDGPDLVSFLRNSEENIKFPLLSGHSTPTTQKNRDDDNESTCTSIRNFMTEILQDEEMPDTEARIIKEVIEEEADLLDDSLESHWLQDDCIDNDSRLDFSFSPFTTPNSVNNDHCYTPIKQIEPSLRCKNNHAKRVLQQLPTTYTNEDITAKLQNKSILQNKFEQKVTTEPSLEEAFNEELGVKYTNDDSITELINQNEFILNQGDSNDFVPESQTAVKSISMHNFGIKSKETLTESPTYENVAPVKTIDLSAFETELTVNRNKSDETENDIAVKSITLNTFGKKTENNVYEVSETENDIDVKSVSLNDYDTADITNALIDVSDIGLKSKDNREEYPVTEIDLAIKTITRTDSDEKRNTHEIIENHGEFTEVILESNSDQIRNAISKMEIDLAVNSIKMEVIEPKSQVNHEKGNYVVNEIFEEIIEDNKSDQSQEKDLLFDTTIVENRDNYKHESFAVDTIDKNLEEALKDHSNQNISLDDLLVSPARVYAQSNGITSGISTPTINNILFGEKLEDDSSHKTASNIDKNEEGDGEIDALEEFFKEGVKDFEGKIYDPELPLELKYDLPTCTCKMCSKTFSTLKALKIHLTKIHYIRFPRKKVEITPKECNHCGKIVNDSRNFSKHLRIHNKEKQKDFKCELCGLTISSNSKYKMHMKMHSVAQIEDINEPKKYMCNVCGALFKTSSNFAVHKRRHTTNYLYTCGTCDKGFHRAIDLNTHIKTRHTGERPYECPLCKKRYVTKYFLGVHMRKHTEKPFECDYCSKRFQTKTSIAYHIHNSKYCKRNRNNVGKNNGSKVKIRPFHCSNCPMKFAKKYTLVKHQNQTACGKKDFYNEDSNSVNNVTLIVYEDELPQNALILNEQ